METGKLLFTTINGANNEKLTLIPSIRMLRPTRDQFYSSPFNKLTAPSNVSVGIIRNMGGGSDVTSFPFDLGPD